MYNYNFENELVIYEKNNCFMETKDKEIFVNILITNKNLLIFYNQNNDFLTMKAMGVFVSPNNNLLMKISLDNIKYECEENNTYINDEIVLYDFNLESYLDR